MCVCVCVCVCVGGGHIELNSGSNNSRGVAIMFRPNLDYEITSGYSDNIGRVLWLNKTKRKALFAG